MHPFNHPLGSAHSAPRPHELRVTLLGTGTSTGVPVIGCRCRVCTSSDPRDKRLRCSAWVRTARTSLLIDTGPDFRLQALRYGIPRIDAVLYTHHHFDHVMGLDELRAFNYLQPDPIPLYASPEAASMLRHMFRYVFLDPPMPGIPKVQLNEIIGPFRIGELDIQPIPVWHGPISVLGFRIGPFAYVTDVSQIPEQSLPLLEGLEVLVLGALRYRPHPMHFSIHEAVSAARRLGAKQTYLIHLTHEVLHAEAEADLPEFVQPAYDGLELRIPWLKAHSEPTA
ncbi:MAG: MBL fold metallo-hydrolase [Bacteroidota bacterium]|nr:MBL fold metallo-hydrolase [Rhodothermia bacterium]MCS7155445.1 MBL fold metallo-hydrolase [Bacteroidota bacterium]MDW8138456.1 MBL fold metallo-hydrolase [Bacteroidota bacterium]MDW8284607.1 MBL fold metallo-hydrolase [Bacteroidota bacterium]